jgi:hypothetical protein
MMRLMSLAASVLLTSAPVRAEPYWYAYEGNDFPENEGWERWVSDPAPERWLEDGDLFIDSRGLVGSSDDYGIRFDSGVDPGPGETFIMSWRLMVEETTHRDPGVYVHSDEAWSVSFLFDTDSLISVYEPTVYVDIEPYVYHEYEMRSSDMRNYELYIDGDLAIEGVFFEGFFPLVVGFGDVASNTSLAAWDYFHFGVVPEPATWLMVGITSALFGGRRWRSKA